MQNTPLIRILFCFAVHPHPSRLSHGSYVMFKKIGSDSHDLLDSPLSVSCNLAARVGAERIRARYHSLKLPRFMALVRDARKAGVNGGRSANSAFDDLPWR